MHLNICDDPAKYNINSSYSKSTYKCKSMERPNKLCKTISFTGVPCLKVYMDRKKPIDFFKLLVTNKLANMMVLETKQYANQEIN